MGGLRRRSPAGRAPGVSRAQGTPAARASSIPLALSAGSASIGVGRGVRRREPDHRRHAARGDGAQFCTRVGDAGLLHERTFSAGIWKASLLVSLAFQATVLSCGAVHCLRLYHWMFAAGLLSPARRVRTFFCQPVRHRRILCAGRLAQFLFHSVLGVGKRNAFTRLCCRMHPGRRGICRRLAAVFESAADGRSGRYGLRERSAACFSPSRSHSKRKVASSSPCKASAPTSRVYVVRNWPNQSRQLPRPPNPLRRRRRLFRTHLRSIRKTPSKGARSSILPARQTKAS